MQMEVNEAVEVLWCRRITFEEACTETRYVLEDFDAKPTIGKSSSISSKHMRGRRYDSLNLKQRCLKQKSIEIQTESEEVSPLSLTITELQKRAEETKKNHERV